MKVYWISVVLACERVQHRALHAQKRSCNELKIVLFMTTFVFACNIDKTICHQLNDIQEDYSAIRIVQREFSCWCCCWHRFWSNRRLHVPLHKVFAFCLPQIFRLPVKIFPSDNARDMFVDIRYASTWAHLPHLSVVGTSMVACTLGAIISKHYAQRTKLL